MELPTNRVIVHIDMDAFYAQVEAKRKPEEYGDKPLAVVQYNTWGDLTTRLADDDRRLGDSPNSIIAVNYEAKARGVKRYMRGSDALKVCPELILIQVPVAHGKSNMSLYRTAGHSVLSVLERGADVCERASIDEVYLDLTTAANRRLAEWDRVHVAGVPGAEGCPASEWWARPAEAWSTGEALLAAAAAVVADLRHAVLTGPGYTCSAGIAHSKLLAKLGSGLHKPNRCTLLPAAGVPALMAGLPLTRLRSLGGKHGADLEARLGVRTAAELGALPRSRLEAVVGEREAVRLLALARGVDGEVVAPRRLANSASCGKTFRGQHVCRDIDDVRKWLGELGLELEERLQAEREEHGRVARLLTVSWTQEPPPGKHVGPGPPPAQAPSISRSCPLRAAEAQVLADDAAELFRRWTAERRGAWTATSLFLEASKFADVPRTAISRFFKVLPEAGVEPEQRQATNAAPHAATEQAGAATTHGAGNGSRDVAAAPPVKRESRKPSTAEETAEQSLQCTTERESAPEGQAPPDPGNPDPTTEFLAALPADVRRELEIQMSLEAMERRTGWNKRKAGGAPPKTAPARHGPGGQSRGTMEKFLSRSKSP